MGLGLVPGLRLGWTQEWDWTVIGSEDKAWAELWLGPKLIGAGVRLRLAPFGGGGGLTMPREGRVG